MATKHGTGQSVELVYRPAPEDGEECLRIVTRLSLRTFVLRYLRRSAVLMIAAVFLTLVTDVLILLVGGAVGAAVGLLLGFLRFRAAKGALARRLSESAGAGEGRQRLVVDGSGVRRAAAGEQTVSGWDRYPQYVETTDLFVLLGEDQEGLLVTPLPKRGARGTEGVNRLREILDRHSALAA
ncbi:hypothetical protein V1L54_26390 [Streptomyces sp. TRM 70361]|uniref:hypothetical protein n=1 Tax=Streptomyces sp. TRM 70361 TaxID=3116553 RepID=UPI002E7B016C|nr:hypothetical protein [Streptomyces sp. TRM 70361]MEE1942895.1 hypothetical protein [Streptomyces sp. TRM 70361]